MEYNTCLNCEKELTDKYCAGCGQAADTHRITFKNFIFHDLLHGTFHIEKGILFTAKQALLRPGKAALDYILGKRKRYYNVFYLILITVGLILFFRHLYEELYLNLGGAVTPEKVFINEASRKMDQIFVQKSKFIIILFVPFAALNSFLLFNRKKLNLSEHAIIAGMLLVGMLLISLFGHLIFFIDLIIEFSNSVVNAISLIIVASILFYIGYGYNNAFANLYSKSEMTYRILLFFVFICTEVFFLFFIIFGFLSDWKFGDITITPFG